VRASERSTNKTYKIGLPVFAAVAMIIAPHEHDRCFPPAAALAAAKHFWHASPESVCSPAELIAAHDHAPWKIARIHDRRRTPRVRRSHGIYCGRADLYARLAQPKPLMPKWMVTPTPTPAWLNPHLSIPMPKWMFTPTPPPPPPKPTPTPDPTEACIFIPTPGHTGPDEDCDQRHTRIEGGTFECDGKENMHGIKPVGGNNKKDQYRLVCCQKGYQAVPREAPDFICIKN
jgi:hypothetical protein